MAEEIEITGIYNVNNAKWKPFQGEEIDTLIKHKGFVGANGNINTAGERIIDETYRILEMCIDPNSDDDTETGLVLGYVQSGKTLSFTSLTALARDNNFQIIIIIAGTSIPLSEQSYQRMLKDLRIDSRFDRKWNLLRNPSTRAHLDSISNSLEKWSDNSLPKEKCSTVLITVMKQSHRLQKLINILQTIDLKGVPTLIIDDESDQASLNTRGRANARAGFGVNEGEASTIYRRINDLRSVFPKHTFLQYTATPQANLFVNILDRLSPNFIKLLTPGDGYTGGKEFFIKNPNLIRTIPFEEIPTNQVSVNEPPQSLIYALQIFFIGVVIGDIQQNQFNRSMLIHPSRLTADHTDYFNWVNDVTASWTRLLESNDIDEIEELIKDFKIAYEDLENTNQDLIPYEEVVKDNRLLHAIKYTRKILVNASRGRTPEIPWRESYSWILVGGQAMDRGFTVEGLTVTYMPRSLATGQVDTTLQRARFFGYKGSYLGFCRVWLDQNNIDAYRAIIEHEEDVRRRLEEYDLNNKHLNEWEREVVKDRILRLTRPNIIYDGLDRDYFGSEWFIIKAPHDTDSLIEFNSKIIYDFFNSNFQSFNINEGHNERTELQKHLVAELPLSDTLQYLLNRLKFTKETDSQTFSSLRGIINSFLNENSEETCLVYIMSAEKSDSEIIQTVRARQLNDNNEIQQLFQGANTKTKKYNRGEIYPGDRYIRDENQLTIQIHRLRLTDKDGNNLKDDKGNIIYADVPSIAIWIPENIGKDIIRQPDNRL